MIQLQSFTFNAFQENTYLIYDETKECIIIDPGCYHPQEQKELKSFIDRKNLKPVKLLNTHCHIDHVLGNRFVADTWSIDLEIHALDLPTLHSVKNYCELYGFHNYDDSPEPKHFLSDGDFVHFGNSQVEVLFTPGHAPGHIAFYALEQEFIISGDVLFQMSIGRTDLPGGDYNTLIESIKRRLLPLSENTTVYCGHGSSTTIGYEKINNPFLNS